MTFERGNSISCKELFKAFFMIGLCGFGGVLPWAYRMLVEIKKWLTQEEFSELLSVGQTIPGPNIVNLSVMLGTRSRGLKGALSAMGGLLLAPFGIILFLGLMYERYGSSLIVHNAIKGIAVVAPGLVIATALKMIMAQRRKWGIYLIGSLAFIGSAIIRVPLIWLILALLPMSILFVGRHE